jgi:hypothetical protein
MKKLAISLLALLAFATQAQWIVLGTNPTYTETVYVGAPTIQVWGSDAAGTAWFVRDLRDGYEPKAGMGLVKSVAMLELADCRQRTLTTLEARYHRGHMAEGQAVVNFRPAEPPVQMVQPGSTGELKVAAICDRAVRGRIMDLRRW